MCLLCDRLSIVHYHIILTLDGSGMDVQKDDDAGGDETPVAEEAEGPAVSAAQSEYTL